MHKAIVMLGRAAKKHGGPLRKSYVRVAKRAALMAGRYAHAKQFKRHNRQLKFLRTRLGRLTTRALPGSRAISSDRTRLPESLPGDAPISPVSRPA